MKHWLWAALLVFAVYVLAISRFDVYYHYVDEFMGMYDAGWLLNYPWSPIEIMDSIHLNSWTHLPVYFFLLSLWGQFTTYDVEIARLLTCFTALLAMAMTYRLVRDFVAPAAGFFALVIIASNAYYSWHIWFARMYPLMLFQAALIFWLYLRIMYSLRNAKLRHYLALAILLFILIYTHLFNGIFLLLIGIYHILFAPKNRRWLTVALAAIIPLLLFAPYFSYRLPYLQGAQLMRQSRSVWYHEALSAWFLTTTNGAPIVILPSLLALIVAFRKRMALKPHLFIFPFFLILLTLMARYTTWIAPVAMRYFFASWLFFVIFLAATLHILYKVHRAAGLLVLLYVCAGLLFENGDLPKYRNFGGIHDYGRPPIHVVSRLALREQNPPVVIGFHFDTFRLQRERRPGLSEEDYYFNNRNITLRYADDPDHVANHLEESHANKLPYWLVYQTSKTTEQELEKILSIIIERGYHLQDTVSVGIDTVILQMKAE